ncbi:tubulin-like doman-containing protein [uncultured Thiodictyon sp.]|uniref:tubulin-like doman-containing protein n=1 Tax=uncultured Thiodictyon sp. TaxID=1846217 RepID=UPI0026009371|nr:tubulin-like doman-containing protein [uncultured Thiodictyon sp.]
MINHLFIGLGGQGCRTLGEIRKVMAQRAVDTTALHDQGVEVQFLAIDSSLDVKHEKRNWSYFGTDLSLQPNDWLELSKPQQNAVGDLAIRPDIAPWLGDLGRVASFLSQSKIEGANQRRRLGRLLFAFNADSIAQAVFTNKVGALTAGRKNQCAFHIFATLGGGTGSGCILDLVATIRHRFPQSGIEEFPIFVYVYATDEDISGADVGYFFRNCSGTPAKLPQLRHRRVALERHDQGLVGIEGLLV